MNSLPYPQIEETYIETNGVRLHVVLAGPPNGSPVVLLHGFPEFWRGWIHQVGPLAAAGLRVIVPDQRGYNLSSVPRAVAAYRQEELVKDVVGLLDVFGYPGCYLAGHDWGAAVAWQAALTVPERVIKLAILNVPHPAVMSAFLKRNPRQVLKSWYIAFFQVPGLADWLVRLGGYQPGLAALRRTSRPGTFSQDDLAAYRTAWTNSGGMTGMIHWYRAAVRYPAPKPKSWSLSMPVLLQWGARDAFLSHQMADASLGYCPQGRLICYEDATHWVQHEEAQAVSQALVDFFRAS